MKKLFSYLTIGLFVFALASCGSNSPKGVVKKAVDALVDGDGDAWLECLGVEDIDFNYKNEWKKTQKEVDFECEKGATLNKKAEDSKRLKSVEITDEKIDETDPYSAEVKIKFVRGNGDKDEEQTINVEKNRNGDWVLTRSAASTLKYALGRPEKND